MPARVVGVTVQVIGKTRDHMVPDSSMESRGMAEQYRPPSARPLPQRDLNTIDGNTRLPGNTSHLHSLSCAGGTIFSYTGCDGCWASTPSMVSNISRG